ncbi:CHS_3a_G0025170.mRNA.1.CDS.1 [Saccharomyces cerevisiae]|nr:CDA_G0025510.mRNA.1.CDS.1 [Saccharomyces cerevisiae]CAI4386510.1 BDM_1a_G0026130.mRNA.1.CDS.1 [Saccharomyces cerevisiae]CAI4876052.1 CHS_3a_G0025170.mRNA.1.CDS.1 [Saccharomyces cerevisiae]CAI5257814.1 BAF_HP2_G0025410.mRNA.1.CDS.1 [Saccharomyces cerevisiae]CAI6451685.1 BAF_HP1_G0025730.mRNA.1.CDS.1 [Saccharomyces cerevisiae]
MSVQKEEYDIVEKAQLSVSAESLTSDSESISHNPFDDFHKAERWRKVYESSGYEGLSKFDPEFTWTKDEEKKLVRKMDLKIFLWVFIMFAFLDLIRKNIARAVSDNFIVDLKMNTNDYNLGQTVYLVIFLASELPGNLLSKRFGPERVIPVQIVLWSVICITQAGLKNRGQFIATRCLLGMVQGGFIPDNILYLSYYYTGAELTFRLSFFWCAIPLFQILGSLLASGIIEMRGIHNLAGWQYLFIIEGFLSLSVGVASFYLMRRGPTQTGESAFHKGKSLFTEYEEKIMVNRILRDDPSKGDMSNRQPVTFKEILYTLTEFDLWPLFIQGITAFISLQTVGSYLSLILKSLNYSTFLSNILAIPGQALLLINLPLAALLSRKLKEKSLCVGIANVWVLPFIVSLVALPTGTNPWIKYILLTGILGLPYTHSILAGWVSEISNSVRSRTVGTALYNMSAQVGAIIASNMYRNDDKPYYTRGNKILLGFTCFNICMAVATKFYYISRNKYKDRKWNSMTKEEQINYLDTTKDKGMKRLDYRFIH